MFSRLLTVCMSRPEFLVSNVKIHFKSFITVLEEKHKEGLTFNYISDNANFVTFRINGGGKAVFTLFPKSGHVNVSGIPSFNNVQDTLSAFNNHFGSHIVSSDVCVDNSTASGQIQLQNSALYKLIPLSKPYGYTVSIRPHYFPSAVIRSTTPRKKPTIILFSNGRFIIVGGKSWRSILEVFQILTVLTASV